jgi:hypothetical protein
LDISKMLQLTKSGDLAYQRYTADKHWLKRLRLGVRPVSLESQSLT